MQARAIRAAPRLLTSPPSEGNLGPPLAVLMITAGDDDSDGAVGRGSKIGGRIWTAWTPSVRESSDNRLSDFPFSSRALLI